MSKTYRIIFMPEKARAIQTKYDGDSRLGGFDCGDYPRHSFEHNAIIEFDNSWPLKVVVCGNDEWIPGCSRFRENSKILSIQIVTEGVFKFVQDDRSYEVEAGEMLLIQPGKSNEMSVPVYARKKIMQIGGYLLPAMLSNSNLAAVDVLKPSDPALFIEFFDKAYEASCRKEPGYLRYCSSIAYQMLAALALEIGSGGLPPELNQITGFMNENLAANPDIDAICRRFACSRSSLYRLFKKHLNCSPVDYLIGRKISLAREMLLSRSDSVKEIALKLGYSNQFFFSSEFKKHCGVSPRTYRQEKTLSVEAEK